MVGIGMPIFLSHWYDSTQKNPLSTSGNRTLALEGDALTTRPARWLQGGSWSTWGRKEENTHTHTQKDNRRLQKMLHTTDSWKLQPWHDWDFPIDDRYSAGRANVLNPTSHVTAYMLATRACTGECRQTSVNAFVLMWCVCVCVYTCVCVWVCVCAQLCMCVCARAHTHACVHACVCLWDTESERERERLTDREIDRGWEWDRERQHILFVYLYIFYVHSWRLFHKQARLHKQKTYKICNQ